MIEIWLKEDWKKRSEKASENRTNNPDYMPYTGGSCSVAATHERMNEEAGYEVGHCEVYKKTHSLAKTNDWAHPKGGCFIADYNELQRNAMEAENSEINSSNGSHTLPDNLELWVKATDGKKKGRVLGTRASDPMPLPIPDNMATSQNTTTNYIEIQQQKSKEDFDRAVQEAIRKQMPDILKELREDLRRETIEGQSSQQHDNIITPTTRDSNVENVGKKATKSPTKSGTNSATKSMTDTNK